MHHSQFDDEDGNEWHCNHNGDFSGEVLFEVPAVNIPTLKGMMPEATVKAFSVEVRIPFEVLKDLVGKWLISERISQLEMANPKDFPRVLGLR